MLLAFTTATPSCSAALWQNDGVVAELDLHRPRRHAEQLVPLIRSALTHSSAEIRDLDAVALAAGPGSYTGLRIGASTAKGLCAATGAQLVAVSTLAALAEAARPCTLPGTLVGPVLRSRRGEVYAAAFRWGTPPGRAFADAALETDDAAARLQAARRPDDAGEPAWLLGSGAERVAEALPPDVRASFRVMPEARPTAGAVARLGARRLAAGTVEDVATFEPRYLKPFQATPRRRSAFEESS